MRLQQYLARAGVTSRRKAEELIRSGRVSINNAVAEIGATVGEQDVVRLDGERVRMPTRSVVIALNKPKGYTTTHEDLHAEKLVYQLVPEHPGLHSVGRLDKDTEGLLLLTTDGNLTQKLTHPSNEVPKLYRVWSKRGRLSVAECQRLTEGLMLGDGPAKAMEAVPTKEGAKLVLTEGRKREVRRMLGKIGHPVERLVRLAVGVIELGELEVGQYRYLEEGEIRLLMEGATPPKLRKPTAAARQRRAAKPQEGRQPRRDARPAKASGREPGERPAGKPGDPAGRSRPSRSSQPQAVPPALSEVSKARIAKVVQRLRAEDQGEIPQAASRRAGRADKGGARATAKPARAAEPPAKPRPKASGPRGEGPRPEAQARAKPAFKDRRTEGDARGERPRPEGKKPQRSSRPLEAEPPRRAPKAARGSASAPASGAEGGRQKPARPISQKPKPTVKSSDERVRGGQGQGANQRGANKGADRRVRPKNTK